MTIFEQNAAGGIMSTFEYKVVPAPRRGEKARGVKGTEAMFAHALETRMNALGAQGWEYLRTDTLPCEERQGLTGRTTTYQNMLVFRRALQPAASDTPPMPQIAAPQIAAPQIAAPVARMIPAPDVTPPAASPEAPPLGPATTAAASRNDPRLAAE